MSTHTDTHTPQKNKPQTIFQMLCFQVLRFYNKIGTEFLHSLYSPWMLL